MTLQTVLIKILIFSIKKKYYFDIIFSLDQDISAAIKRFSEKGYFCELLKIKCFSFLPVLVGWIDLEKAQKLPHTQTIKVVAN